MDWVYYVLLLALLVCGIAITVMNLPGLWLMAAASGLYALVTREHYLFPWGLVIVLALCVLAEFSELLVRAGGAKKAGGSKRAMIFGTVGGIVGGIFLSLPVPIVGTIAGVCIGAFVGAMAAQLTLTDDLAHSTRVGFGAAKGTLLGLLAKLAIGVAMFVIVAIMALPFGRSAPNPAPASTKPALTLPTTSTAPSH